MKTNKTKKEAEIVKLPYVSSEEIFNDIKSLANAIESGKELTVPHSSATIDKRVCEILGIEKSILGYVKNVEQQRDDLLEACKDFVFLEKTNMTKKQVQLQIDRAKDVIAQATL